MGNQSTTMNGPEMEFKAIWSDPLPMNIFNLVITNFCAFMITLSLGVICHYLLTKREESKSMLDKFNIYWLIANGILCVYFDASCGLFNFTEDLGPYLSAFIFAATVFTFYQFGLATLAMGMVQYRLVFPNSRVAGMTEKFDDAKLPFYFYLFYWLSGILLYCLVHIGALMIPEKIFILVIITAITSYIIFIASMVLYIILRCNMGSNQDTEQPPHEESYILSSTSMIVGLTSLSICFISFFSGRQIIIHMLKDTNLLRKFHDTIPTAFAVLQMIFFLAIIATSSKLKNHVNKIWNQIFTRATVNPGVGPNDVIELRSLDV